MDARVARGSSVAEEPAEGHVAVMIPYMHYRKVQAYLKAIGSPLKPDELIASVLEDWLRKLNL